MNKRSGEDPGMLRLTEFCLSLPESIRQLSGDHASFLVRKKVFAYYLDNHHGDGIVSVTCKVLPGDNKALVASFPDRKSTRLNSSHANISYAVFCLKKKKKPSAAHTSNSFKPLPTPS